MGMCDGVFIADVITAAAGALEGAAGATTATTAAQQERTRPPIGGAVTREKRENDRETVTNIKRTTSDDTLNGCNNAVFIPGKRLL